MAGAKESPRQKMIGMMYLVLTALLALQVNSAILLKFKFIDDSLLGVNDKTSNANDGTIKGIQEAVAKNRNQKNDIAVLKASEEIRAKTKETVEYLRDVRDKLVTAAGNTKGSNEYKDVSAEDKVAITMLGASRNGLAYPLKDKLNAYSEYIRQYVPGAAPLALDPKDDKMVTEKEQKSKNFAELNFENTPLVAALAVLSQKETEVLKYEADALQKQAEKVGAKTIVFDKIGAFASAESNTVAAGTKYKAELFLTASATGLRPTMTLNGSPLSVDQATQHGKVEFTARPGAFDKDGNAKASWTGTVRVNTNGRDTTFKVLVPYTITKPVMQVQSASVQALYLNCGNKLNVQVPALGAQYKPSFSASGAAVIPGAQKGEVTLVPNGREVTLNVASEGNAIGSQTFKVRQIPRPEIKCFVGGREANERQGTPGTAVRNLQMRAIPDESFANFLPEDARYRVSSYEIVLVRGRRPALPPRTVSSQSADLSDIVNAYHEGDRLNIEVKQVQRLNFRNQVEDVRVSRIFNVPLL
jgi:gliding motility-associated protein GldM